MQYIRCGKCGEPMDVRWLAFGNWCEDDGRYYCMKCIGEKFECPRCGKNVMPKGLFMMVMWLFFAGLFLWTGTWGLWKVLALDAFTGMMADIALYIYLALLGAGGGSLALAYRVVLRAKKRGARHYENVSSDPELRDRPLFSFAEEGFDGKWYENPGVVSTHKFFRWGWLTIPFAGILWSVGSWVPLGLSACFRELMLIVIVVILIFYPLIMFITGRVEPMAVGLDSKGIHVQYRAGKPMGTFFTYLPWSEIVSYRMTEADVQGKPSASFDFQGKDGKTYSLASMLGPGLDALKKELEERGIPRDETPATL